MDTQKQLSKDQVRVILNNAPANLDKSKIVKSLVDQGYQLEGFGQEEPTKSNFIQRGVQNITEAIKNPLEVIPQRLKAVTPGPIVTQNPDGTLTGNRQEAEKAINTALSFTPGGLEKSVSGITKPIKSALTELDNFATNMTAKTADNIESKILSNYQKGVKPSLAGKNTTGAVETYKKNVLEAVNTIKQNKQNLSFVNDLGETLQGETPKTLQQLADSIEQTKKVIFSSYDNLAKQAGEAGVAVDMKPIASELDTVINNKALSITNPKAIEYAQSVKDRLLSADTLDATTAQDVIQNYNKSLEAFYRNPSYDNASQVSIDALLANKIRETLDSGISGLTGEQYGALKKQYGALKSIEKDVVKASLRDARKNAKGLIDFTDILSGGQVVNGILSLSPGQVASGLTQKAISEFYKYLNNPNRAIEKMFE